MSVTKCLLYEDELLNAFCQQLQKADEFSIGMALISDDGLDLISESLEQCLDRGGRGRVLVGIDLPTTPMALDWLVEWRDEYPDQLELRVFQPGKRVFFHPKLSVFKSTKGALSAIAGSANLTHGGLQDNYEVSLLVTEPTPVRTLLELFDECFEGGRSRRIDDAWLQKYRAAFAKRAKAMEALRKARDRVRKLSAPRVSTKPIPKRIRGYKFAFTGKITDWPRDDKLYPLVRKYGGDIAAKAQAMGKVDCLVHGDILGGRKSTQKLDIANEKGIPILHEEEFFQLVAKEKKHRAR